jgi:hypothetical protein
MDAERRCAGGRREGRPEAASPLTNLRSIATLEPQWANGAIRRQEAFLVGGISESGPNA